MGREPEPPMALSRQQVRSIDQIAIEQFGIPGIVLMENAGRGCAEILMRESEGPIVVCAGRGNNGGDGFVLARHLHNAGIAVQVLLFGDSHSSLKGDAKINFQILKKMNLKIVPIVEQSHDEIFELLKDADWLVDALLGTGAIGKIREPFITAIECMNESGKPILAIDVPSGLDCDTGEANSPCIRATKTASCVAFKRGFSLLNASEFLGDEIEIVDIGVPRVVLELV